jgi:hypothetical protein
MRDVKASQRVALIGINKAKGTIEALMNYP